MGLLADLVKSDHVPSRDAGSAILCRLIAAIGSSSLDRKCGGEHRDVRFSRELIDGRLLSKSTREIRLTATETDTLIPGLPPLSEEEVNHHWTPLSDIWVSVAQQRLDLGDGSDYKRYSRFMTLESFAERPDSPMTCAYAKLYYLSKAHWG